MSENSMYNISNELVEEVIVMLIGVSLVALALPIGIFLAVDLFREQHRSSTQNNL